MTKKKEIIAYINATEDAVLTNSNTSYSKINKSKAVWWLNVAPSKFKAPVNLLLKTEDVVFWVVLPFGFVSVLSDHFRIRKDKNVVDLEINAGSRNFLCDVKSGGTGFSFGEFVKEEIYLLNI